MNGRRSLKGRLAAALGVVSIVSGVLLVNVVVASPTSFVPIDGNIRFVGPGTFDWANSGATGGTSTCTGAEIHVTGTNGLFDCGLASGSNTTPPTAPRLIATDPTIVAADFVVDPIASDVTTCGSGDPTAYTGAGGEKNGDLLTSETYGTASIPAKDDLSNVYAIAHKDPPSSDNPTINEIFIGSERIVNNGDSHIDYEFLQADVTKTGTCSGGFTGGRTQGDIIIATDFTTGGTVGEPTVYKWQCDTVFDVTKNGTVCNPGGKSKAHYEAVSDVIVLSALSFAVNGSAAKDCGGWVCRDTNGAPRSTVPVNEFFEAAIDLKALGFSGCINSFLPHTRSSQSFTATLKDFTLARFNTCRPATQLSGSVSPHVTGDLTTALIHKGDSVTATFTEANTGNVTLSSPHLDLVVTGTATGTGCTGTLSTPVSGDTNSDGKLDPGETWVFTCTRAYTGVGTSTITGTGHGTFNGVDVSGPSEIAAVNVRVFTPATTLVKSASPTSIHSGGSVTYTYTETNGSTGGNGTSDLAISSVSITDTVGGLAGCSPVALQSGDTNSNSKLDATETWVFTCSTTLTSTTTNIATATGTDALGATVTWCATPASPPTGTICSQLERSSATVTVIAPATSLTEVAAATVSITYTYKEDNTGDDPISNPTVADPNCTGTVTYVSGDTNSNGKLDTTETWTFTCTSTSVLSVDTDPATATLGTASIHDTGTGSGTDSLGGAVGGTGDPTENDGTTVSVTATHTGP